MRRSGETVAGKVKAEILTMNVGGQQMLWLGEWYWNEALAIKSCHSKYCQIVKHDDWKTKRCLFNNSTGHSVISHDKEDIIF